MLLLFRRKAKSLSAQDERLATSLNRCKAPPAARTLCRRCYPQTDNGGHSWRLNSSPSLSVGFSAHDKGMGVAHVVVVAVYA